MRPLSSSGKCGCERWLWAGKFGSADKAELERLRKEFDRKGFDPSGASQPAAPDAMSGASSGSAQFPEQIAEVHETGGAPQLADTLMEDIRILGRLPRECKPDECTLARKLDNAKRRKRLSTEQLAEIEEIRARTTEAPTEADAPPDPLDPFADEAANRLEQDLLMASNGMRPTIVMRRIHRYRK